MESEKISDSKWLASLVVAAYTEERYELGEALARLCGQAHRMERAAAPAPGGAGGFTEATWRPVDPESHEPKHVQELVRTHERPATTEGCQTCGVAIDWSIGTQRWVHINGEGQWVTSPLPAHDGVPALAVNESNAPAPAEEAPTAVVPSGRCIAPMSGGAECHGVIYWTVAAAGLPAGWVHLDPSINRHDPVPNRPDPTR